MRASTIIALVIVVAGAAVLIFSHEAGMIGGISNDQFASIVAMVAILIWMGGGAFSGRLRTDMRNFMIWLGVAAYVVEFFVWLAFLSMVPLAQGVLVGSVNILTVQLGGRIFFKELLTPKRILASAMVAGGVALVGWAG